MTDLAGSVPGSQALRHSLESRVFLNISKYALEGDTCRAGAGQVEEGDVELQVRLKGGLGCGRWNLPKMAPPSCLPPILRVLLVVTILMLFHGDMGSGFPTFEPG